MRPPRLSGDIDVDKIDLGAVEEAMDVPGAAEPVPEPGGVSQDPSPDADDGVVAASAGTSAADASPGESESEPESESFATPRFVLPVAGEFALRIKEISGLPMTVRDLVLNLDVAEEAASADLSVECAEALFTGKLELERNAADRTVAMDVHLDGKEADFTRIIHFYMGDERLSGRFNRAVVDFKGTGSSLKDAWDRRHVDIQIAEASMSFLTDDKDWKFFLETGSIQREHGSPGEIHAKGTLSDAAYEIRMPFHIPEGASYGRIDGISGKIADVEFEMRDATAKDADQPYSLLEFDLKGGRLDRLDAIYELDLPPLGPYSASGSVDFFGNVLKLQDLKLKVGESLLHADVQLDKTDKPHTLTATLNAETIQLDDFDAAGWSPTGGKEEGAGAEPAEPAPATPAGESIGETVLVPRGLISHEVLSSINANIQLEVGEVLSGSDQLGKGEVKLTLEDARLQIEPLTLAIPGGRFQGSLFFHPKADKSLDWKVRLNAERADYSVVARRLDPDTKLAGVINLDLDVGANGVPFGAPQLNMASGRLAFSVCPENLDAGVLDLWATNIVVALLPTLDPDNKSKLNCVLGELHLKDGQIFPETLGLDTTTMRMSAEGGIDLREGTIDLKLTPYPKRPQLLSVEAPVSITGSLTEPTIEMGALPVARTIGRMAKNILLFPIKTIAGDKLPEDGSDICACLANYTPNPELEGELVPEEVEDKEDED